MNKCETCLNSRPIISENGLHSVCCLSSKKAVDCIINKKDYYVPKVPIKSSEVTEQ